jgi:hypothetical protein
MNAAGGTDMKNASILCGLVLGASLSAALMAPATVQAGGYPAPAYSSGSIALSCENGRVYPLRVRAVSDFGEIVTGYLSTSPRHAVHVRLIPMGDGYRYAGRGIWFDGKRDVAVLYFGQNSAVNCTVLRDEGVAITAKG